MTEASLFMKATDIIKEKDERIAALESELQKAATSFAGICRTLDESGKNNDRMKAALEMVLLFHSGESWRTDFTKKWFNLQIEVGKEQPYKEATTKVLCDTIREILVK